MDLAQKWLADNRRQWRREKPEFDTPAWRKMLPPELRSALKKVTEDDDRTAGRWRVLKVLAQGGFIRTEPRSRGLPDPYCARFCDRALWELL